MLDDPTFLLGMPRSGTTWLSQLIEAHPAFLLRLSPNYSYPLKNRLDPDSSADEWIDVLGQAVASTDAFMTQDWQREQGKLAARPVEDAATRLAVKDTRFHDTYLAGLDVLPEAKAVYLVRHPCAVLDSWRRSPEFPADAEWSEEWRTGATRKLEGPGEFWGFDDWVLVTNRYLDSAEHAPDRVRVVRFESLVREPESTIGELMQFLGAEVDDAMLDFARRSHETHDPDPYAIRKDPATVLDAWRGRLDEWIQATVTDELAGTRLEQYLR